MHRGSGGLERADRAGQSRCRHVRLGPGILPPPRRPGTPAPPLCPTSCSLPCRTSSALLYLTAPQGQLNVHRYLTELQDQLYLTAPQLTCSAPVPHWTAGPAERVPLLRQRLDFHPLRRPAADLPQPELHAAGRGGVACGPAEDGAGGRKRGAPGRRGRAVRGREGLTQLPAGAADNGDGGWDRTGYM